MEAASVLLRRLAGHAPVLLSGPVGPDGDSIGACLGLQRVLRARGVPADVAGRIPPRYRWMPGVSEIVPDPRVGLGYRAVVVLDGDRHRLTREVEHAFAAAELKAIVDHHATTTEEGYDVAWIDRTAGSTCEMLYRELAAWGTPVDRDLATLLYTGIVFDTGGFRHSNTTPQTFRIAAELLAHGVDHAGIVTRVLHERSRAGLAAAGRVYSSAELACGGALCVGSITRDEMAGLPDGDLEGVVECLLMVEGVEVAALLTERPRGQVKHSLRSRGLLDVAGVAAALSPTGGGHPKAAGAVQSATIDEAKRQLVAVVAAELEASARSIRDRTS